MPERAVGFGRSTGGSATPTAGTGGGPALPAVPGLIELGDDAAAALLPDRAERGHKGSFGKLLVLAGSLDYAGAAFLVCSSAARTGAGLVTLAVPESLQPLFAAKVVEATTMGLPEDDVEELEPEDALTRILDHEHDAIVVGPGLRPGLATRAFIEDLLVAAEEPSAAPIVLDAEALRGLASTDNWWDGVRRPAVLTPHVGEFRRLRAGSGHAPDEDGDLVDDDPARAQAAAAAALEWGHVVVLKGARTVIASGTGEVAVAPFENPALATGGTGDVLAGAIGSLLAQGLRPFDAACLGVYLHGLAGDAVRERLGDAGLIASDLPIEIALARHRLADLAERNRRDRRLGFAVAGEIRPKVVGPGSGTGTGEGPGDTAPEVGPGAPS